MPNSIRCSRLPLLQACAASHAAADPIIDTAGDEARLGTAFHELQASAIQGIYLEAADVARKWGVDADELEMLGRMGWSMWEKLRDFFPDPMTERFMVRNIGCVTLSGHADVLSTQGRRASVLDWKSGYADPRAEWQLRGYGLLALDDYPQCDEVYSVCATLRDGVADGRRYTRDELSDWWFTEVVPRLQQSDVYSPGRHCGYCKRAAACPAKSAMLTEAVQCLVLSDGLRNRDCAVPLTPKLAAELKDRVKLVRDLCDQADAAIRSYVNVAGRRRVNDRGEVSRNVPIGDGRELALITRETREIVPPLAWPVLVEKIGIDRLLSAVRISKTEVEKIVAADAPYRQGKAAKQQLVEVLDGIGALEVKSAERLEVRKVTEELEYAS